MKNRKKKSSLPFLTISNPNSKKSLFQKSPKSSKKEDSMKKLLNSWKVGTLLSKIQKSEESEYQLLDSVRRNKKNLISLRLASVDLTRAKNKYSHTRTCSNHTNNNDKFLSSEDFIKAQMKIGEIYEEKQKRKMKIKADRDKIKDKFRQEDLEKQKEKELEEYLSKERAKVRRKEIKQRIQERRLKREREKKLVYSNF